MTAAPLLEVADVSRSFGGFQALGGVTLRVEPGEISAVIGPNGAGKTTLFNVITGHLVPDSGRVLPVITSIMVVLPAPLGPITQRSSPTSIDSDSLFSAWKPSKLTEISSR